MQHSAEFATLCNDAKSRVQEISIDTTAQLIAEGKAPLLIDTRETAEFTAKHLPNALHLSRGIIEIHIHTFLPSKDTPAILYCGGGNRSALAADNLQKMGYTHITSMAGGFREWVAKDKPVSTD